MLGARGRLVVVISLVAATCTRADAGAPSNPPPQSPPAPGTVGCSAAGSLAAPGTLLLFRSNGCVPARRLMGFRCAPDEPAVIQLGAGTRRSERFVGGPWATAVDLPTDAVPIGEGANLQVYRVPGDPRMLYVGEGDTVTRWLRLPRLAPSEPPSAYVIGDSIADGAAPFIVSALPGWTIGFDTVIGRGTSSALTTAAEQGAARPDVVVVELGTNDADPAAFRANAVAILDDLRDVPLVLWQTAHGPLPNIPGVNVRIRGLVPRYPNAVVANWDAFVNDAELSADGVHPAAGQEDLMARLITPMLTRWLEIARGGGATSCAEAAEFAAGVS